MQSLTARLTHSNEYRLKRAYDAAAELQLKVKAKDLKLSAAERTIEELRSRLETTENELKRSLSKHQSLEKKVKEIYRQTEDEALPRFAKSMMTSFRNANVELIHERDKLLERVAVLEKVLAMAATKQLELELEGKELRSQIKRLSIELSLRTNQALKHKRSPPAPVRKRVSSASNSTAVSPSQSASRLPVHRSYEFRPYLPLHLRIPHDKPL